MSLVTKPYDASLVQSLDNVEKMHPLKHGGKARVMPLAENLVSLLLWVSADFSLLSPFAVQPRAVSFVGEIFTFFYIFFLQFKRIKLIHQQIKRIRRRGRQRSSAR